MKTVANGASVIGFMHNVGEDEVATRPFELHRLVPMARVLADFGSELFAFCPDQVDLDEATVAGYTVGRDGFERCRRAVPAVSGDWYLGRNRTRRANGLSRRGYHRWARRRGLEIDSDHRLSRLLKDKLRTFTVIEETAPGLHPPTRLYDGSAAALEDALGQCTRVFLKPLRGNMGNGVIVAKRERSRIRLCLYDAGRRIEHSARSVRAATAWIEARRDPRAYVIQHGVDMPRHEDGAFVVRTIVVDDGERWRPMHKAVLAPPGGDVANTTQLGSNHRLSDLLIRLYGVAEAPTLQARVEEASLAVARAFDRRFPGRVMELGLDLLLDVDGRAHLIEANTKPGMMKPGLPKDGFPNIFDLSADEMVVYGNLVAPHATYLAHYLQTRLTSGGARRAA
ncbi:MAG: hypothetical protein HKO59_09145 [Phycisphaerales bacterium]|nr:YheC/YheD family protein [Phycisphaerae bacterium]NNF43206.1 hypothetical protein [Phycisphaerales bacterium]NNM26135.1 hypothetical protein [Phycisphaerales bacterium]